VWQPGGFNHEFALSTNGWLEYQPGTGYTNESFRVSSGAGGAILPLPGRRSDNLEDPAISPDGRFLAMRLLSPGSAGQADLWILDRRQGTLARFSVGGGRAPVWSRDGRRLAYAVSTGDSGVVPGIYVRASNLSGSPQLLLAGDALYPASWLVGDRGLIFISWPEAKADIGVIALGDSVPRWILNSEFNEYAAQLSPDGKRLAFSSDRTGRTELYVLPMTPGTAPTQISTEGGHSPRWSADGKTLFYVQRGALLAAGIAPGEGMAVTSRRVVMESGLDDTQMANVNWDIFPDGKQFLYIDQVGQSLPRIALIQNWVEMVRAMGAPR
ncbi:MAG: hypothetical protein AABZ80_12745, partial [Gemmatimonadota bacterium]